jgi:hypothetical protein
MENVALGFALSAWLALTVWLNAELRDARKALKAEVEAHMRLLVAAEELIDRAKAAPSPLPEIYTPEQMAEGLRGDYVAASMAHNRRWRDQQQGLADISKALKWDDAAKGEQ